MKVSECLNNIPEVSLGYIRIVKFAMGGDGEERTLDTFTSKELIDVQQKDAPAYYNIGSYWYVLCSK